VLKIYNIHDILNLKVRECVENLQYKPEKYLVNLFSKNDSS